MWDAISEDELFQLIQIAESKMLDEPLIWRCWSRIKSARKSGTCYLGAMNVVDFGLLP